MDRILLSNRNIILLLKKHLAEQAEYIHFENGENVMLNKKSVDDINVKGKKILVRCDFNVPLIDGKITDENRLVEKTSYN